MAATATTPARLLLKRALPSDMQGMADDTMDTSDIKSLFGELAQRHPDQYPDIAHNLTELSRDVLTDWGNETSVSMNDLKLPESMKALREDLRKRTLAILTDRKLSQDQKNRQVVALVRKYVGSVPEKLMTEADKTGNVFAQHVARRFRGSPSQLSQLLFGTLLSTGANNQPVPVPGLHSYSEGLTPAEYFAASFGARRGLAEVQKSTAATGFFGKQMALMAHNATVTGDDCGADSVGKLTEGGDPDAMGTVLAADAGPLKKGTVIDEDNISELEGEEVLVRSPLTCRQPEGVCRKCVGQTEKGKFPAIGSFIGVAGARMTSEPMTQLGLESKHTGGAVGVNDDRLSGFEEINQFLQIPEEFRGAAVLAPGDGRVGRIAKAPQGGQYLIIDGEQVYIPENRKLQVKQGDSLEAGDALTDGLPNPAEVTRYKGLGEGRRYFADKFAALLEENKIEANRKHVDTISRAFLDKVEVTDPDGIAGYEVGETAPYSEIQRNYTPRKEARPTSTGAAVNMYLEKPVLHYSIGTRVTPSVVETLRRNKIKSVTAHPKPPGFEPKPVRMMAALGEDPDWKVRLAGFDLTRNFLDSVTHGATSKRGGASFVPYLMEPDLFSKKRSEETEG